MQCDENENNNLQSNIIGGHFLRHDESMCKDSLKRRVYFNLKYLIYDQNNVWHKMMAHIMFDTISHADITQAMTGKIDHLVEWEKLIIDERKNLFYLFY